MLSGSRFAFFKSGVTMACFMERGTTPDVIDELIRCVRKGARSSAIDVFQQPRWNRINAQVVDCDLIIS